MADTEADGEADSEADGEARDITAEVVDGEGLELCGCRQRNERKRKAVA